MRAWAHLWIGILLVAAAGLQVGCLNSSVGARTYPATVAEGRHAVQETMASTQASSISVALVDREGVVWSQAFGAADPATGRAATPETLYSIASVSKMLATSAVMKLVDQGRIDLDEPVVTYLPAFSMPLDPRYRDITVRMLLCHASGLPGYSARGAETLVAFPGYAAQVMADLAGQRLTYAPGRLNCYNNNGFTMVQNLVEAVAGQDYPAFVREQLLDPLGMAASRYQVQPLPEASYAHAVTGTTPKTLFTVNVYATGGLFSTPGEMGRLARMFLGGGQYGSRAILSARSVAAMGENQRLGTFDPVPCSVEQFGLGWDTVAEPCLAAVGVRAWQKGGDLDGAYGASLVVAPDEGLAVVVLGASNAFSSTYASRICERILLRALVERGRIPAMPEPLAGADLPAQVPSQADQDAYQGLYGSGLGVYRVRFSAGGVLDVDTWENAWTPTYQSFHLRSDGWYAADGAPNKGVRLLTRNGRAYFALRDRYGYGNYRIQSLYGQQLEARTSLSAAWQARAAETWLPVDWDPSEFLSYAKDPSLRFTAVDGLPGHLLSTSLYRDFDPADGDRLDGMFLDLPDGVRDLQDVVTEAWQGETWLRAGARRYRPASAVPDLGAGTTQVTLGALGFTEWRRLPGPGRLTVTGGAGWSLHGADLAQLAVGTGAGGADLPGTGPAWLALLGDPGAAIQVRVDAP